MTESLTATASRPSAPSAPSVSSGPLTAFVSFPSPYTQTLLVSALVAVLPSISITLVPPEEDAPPQLQWADYDLLTFTLPHARPSDFLTSSYVYRKALIRKHQLHTTIAEYVAKARHRGAKTVLERYRWVPAAGAGELGEAVGQGSGEGIGKWEGGGVPEGWVVDIQFADELDELLLDDLYELADALSSNLDLNEEEKRWFILKPGFADRAQGIRMFSTEEELRAIFESFEPPSDDEEDDEDDDEEENDEDGDAMESRISAKLAAVAMADHENDEDEDEGTGVMTSHLRHFVIQEYLPHPMLFDIDPSTSSLQGYKFHLRAYVLVTGGYTVHLAHTMLALFSGSAYTSPRSPSSSSHLTFNSASDSELTSGINGLDLRPHLTNTCLQTDAYGALAPPEHLVRLFWDLEGETALTLASGEGESDSGEGKYEEVGKVDNEWLEETYRKVGEVVAEAVKAGAECGSFGLQLVPNAFEIFGVDLMLSFPPDVKTSTSLPSPRVTLLEFNASPDFHQSGMKLRPQLAEMFRGVVRTSVAPFFGAEVNDEAKEEKHKVKDSEGEEEKWEVGEERWGWTMVGQGEVRGQWA